METLVNQNVTINDTVKKTPEEFAQNYRTITADGQVAGITVGSINVILKQADGNTLFLGAYDAFRKDYPANARIIYNLAVKTMRSGLRGASYSCQIDRPVTGVVSKDWVDIKVQNGYVQSIKPAKMLTLTEASKAASAIVVSAEGTMVDSETGEIVEGKVVADDMSESHADAAIADSGIAKRVKPKMESEAI